MSRLFSARHRARVWRETWVALAEAQAELGIGGVTDEQVVALRAAIDDIDLDRVAELERELRHDVMAHVHAYGERAEAAAPILHLGATSAFVVDNADLLIMREAMRVVKGKTLAVVAALAPFARRHSDLPTLSWTHFQPAQPTTVGKRACLWISDLIFSLDEIEYRLDRFALRGLKGTTGTQASFLVLAEGDERKVVELERRIVEKLGARAAVPIAGQTYSRRIDSAWAATLAGIAEAASKFSYDMRLLQHLGEILEPFGERQVGSSAMPYKRNPMRSERMTGLSRYAMQTAGNLSHTAAVQWLERSLDDSSNKRMAIPELFLAIDAVLVLYHSVAEGLEVCESAIDENLRAELSTMASESLLMAAVARGGDRQELHERIRVHALASRSVSADDEGVDLLQRLREDAAFAALGPDVWSRAIDPDFLIGRAPAQVAAYLADIVEPLLESAGGDLSMSGEIRV